MCILNGIMFYSNTLIYSNFPFPVPPIFDSIDSIFSVYDLCILFFFCTVFSFVLDLDLKLTVLLY
jgi:hypothetical protein